MANKKGGRVEPGIWRRADAEGYIAEVNYPDPMTGQRIREQKTIHRLDLAQEWRLTRKADALRGEVRRKKDQPKAVRFELFVTEYLEKWSKLKKKESTYTRDRYSTERLKTVFGRRMLSEIRRRDVEDYVAQRLAAGRSPATVNRELCCLKNMLRKAVDWEYIEKNPAWGVKQQRESPPEFEFLLTDEIDRLIEVYTPELKPLVILAINTGMRRGELFKLEWRDVDFNTSEKGQITVRDTKTHDTRYIPMNDTVREALRKHPPRIVGGKRCPWVFTRADGGPLKSVQKAHENSVERSKIEKHIRFHDLRHTFASHLIMKGVDLRTVAKLMGHKDIKMTMRYAHLAPDHLQAAVDVLTRKSAGQDLAVRAG